MRTWKKVLCVILVLMMVLALASCAKKDGDKAYHSSRFIVVEENNGAAMDLFGYYKETVFYDKETGVMYLGVRAYNQLAMTVLLNSDGTPMIYQPNEELAD